MLIITSIQNSVHF